MMPLLFALILNQPMSSPQMIRMFGLSVFAITASPSRVPLISRAAAGHHRSSGPHRNAQSAEVAEPRNAVVHRTLAHSSVRLVEVLTRRGQGT